MSAKIKVNGKLFDAEEGENLLEALKTLGFSIPSLCHLEGVGSPATCGLCLVEVKGKGVVKACQERIKEGMEVTTNTPEIGRMRKENLLFLLLSSRHPSHCLFCDEKDKCEGIDSCLKGYHIKRGCKNCPMDGRCQIQEAARGIEVALREIPDPRDMDVVEEPFFVRDYNWCILCGRCVLACNQVRKEKAVFTQPTISLTELDCKFCGACVDVCITPSLRTYEEDPDLWGKTICPYCGVGCGIEVGMKGEKVVAVRGDGENPVNRGELCVKGRFGIEFVQREDRLKKPLLKTSTGFEEISWSEALDIASRELKKREGFLGFLSSAKCTNEENYLMQKLARAVFKTNNIDHCARLCHASTASALSMSLGSAAMTNSIEDLEDARTILLIGTNTTENHPIVGLKVKRAVEKGAKLIVVNPLRIDLCDLARVWIRIKPGRDTFLLTAMAKVIVEEGLYDRDFLEKNTENFEEYLEYIKKLSLKELLEKGELEKDQVFEATKLYATNKPSSILFAMGITQHINGTDNVLCLSNLALLTGNLGIRGSGINPLRGQNNVQGACDMGCLPNVLPGYQDVSREDARREFEKAWGVDLPKDPGLTVVEMMKEAGKSIKALYIMGENPALSDPNLKKTWEALEKLEFLLVQDIFLSDTARFAHLVLPGASFLEKEGTFTNTERRVQTLNKILSPPGNAVEDWRIICLLAEKLGFKRLFNYSHPREIYEEMQSLTPLYAEVEYGSGRQWGGEILHEKGIARGKGRFFKVEPAIKDEVEDESYPFILTTGRSLFHFHTKTMTGRVEGLNRVRGVEYAEICQEDAELLGLKDWDRIRIISRRGSIVCPVRITERPQKGVIFLTFHSREAPANILTGDALDPISKIPGFKASAVKVEREV